MGYGQDFPYGYGPYKGESGSSAPALRHLFPQAHRGGLQGLVRGAEAPQAPKAIVPTCGENNPGLHMYPVAHRGGLQGVVRSGVEAQVVSVAVLPGENNKSGLSLYPWGCSEG